MTSTAARPLDMFLANTIFNIRTFSALRENQHHQPFLLLPMQLKRLVIFSIVLSLPAFLVQDDLLY
jgi:hypothetical protein